MANSPNDMRLYLKQWDFHAPSMDVLIGGSSSIDMDEIKLRNWHDATLFLKNYGFDPDDPSQAKHIHAIIVEAWSFIERKLMPVEWARGKRPPERLLYADDARTILLAAVESKKLEKKDQNWACGVLRVMHTIAHLSGVQRLLHTSAAREQIMQRFRSLIFRNENAELRFGNHEFSVAIHHIEWKYKKSRESMILKLLHKKANVAETIYDLIGVRLVTKTLSEVMLLIKILHENHVVAFANCVPSRARNSLFDLVDYESNLKVLKKLVKNDKLAIEDFQSVMDSLLRPASELKGVKNPHSSDGYRSIQLTCRQLIRYSDPKRQWIKKLLAAQTKQACSDLLKNVISEIDRLTKGLNADGHPLDDSDQVVGFFPFEVQIMDFKSFQSNNEGDASHSAYKKSQIRAARRRVLANLLALK